MLKTGCARYELSLTANFGRPLPCTERSIEIPKIFANWFKRSTVVVSSNEIPTWVCEILRRLIFNSSALFINLSADSTLIVKVSK